MDKVNGKARILVVGCGGIGCMAALNLEFGGQAQVTAVLRSSYQIVEKQGFTINSVDHGQVRGFRPTESKLTYIMTVIDSTPYPFVLLTVAQSYRLYLMSPHPASCPLTTLSVPPRIPQMYLCL